MGCGVRGECGVQGSGFGVRGLGFGVWDLGFGLVSRDRGLGNGDYYLAELRSISEEGSYLWLIDWRITQLQARE